MSEILSAKQVNSLFPKRNKNANKGDYGYVALIGGCTKYSGAIRLAAISASSLRSGVGVSTIAAPKSLTESILPNILESTFYPLSDVDGNMKFVPKELDELMARNDVIGFGMGIGDTEETQKSLTYLLENYEGILVVDADGINALAKLPKDKQKEHKGSLILTPHPKEFSRLTKTDVKQVFQDPEKYARECAKELNAIILLKGHRTYISDGSTSYAVDKGGPGMATAGSGDVLAGIVAALAASNKDNLLLATAGSAYINGLAGDLASDEHGETSMLASDSAHKIEEAIQIIEENASLVKRDAPKQSEETAEFVQPEESKDSIQAKSSSESKQEIKLTKEKKEFPKSLIVILSMIFSVLACFIVWVFMLDGYDYLFNKDPREKQASYSTSMDFFEKDIYIDGLLQNNYQLYRPFGHKDERVYVPLTEDICAMLGLSIDYDIENPVEIHLVKTEIDHEGAFYDIQSWDLAKINGIALANVDIYIEDGHKVERLYPDASEVIDYSSGDTIYIPIRLLLDSELLDISAYYDNTGGLYISTDKDIDALDYFSENNLSYINGRIAFMQSINGGLSKSTARNYEYLFRHEAIINELEEDFLMAIAWVESGFYDKAGSPAGAQGLMQIMPSTAKANGMDLDYIYDAHTNIRFGAMYIKNALINFNYNYVKALSAYNFGGNAVYSGAYDTGYANEVLARQDAIRQWMTDNGYSNEFYTEAECTK